MAPLGCKPRLIVIVGPTGVDKTEIAIRLASEWNGEIISADSMQVYRMMDIGTAKPSMEERARVRHHLIDVAYPHEQFNASMFIHMARDIIAALHDERKPIFVVGGTGLYIKTLLGGLFNGPGADARIRKFYRQELNRYGKEHLYNKLKEKDGEAARKIDPNDAVRIIRALEVRELSGESIVHKQTTHGFGDALYECCKIGLMTDRDHLYTAIDDRTDRMIQEGLLEEVKKLLASGYDEHLKPMQSLGYRHMVNYIKERCPYEESIRLMKRDTRRYAKRQMTWFKADREIEWISPDAIDLARHKVESCLSF